MRKAVSPRSQTEHAVLSDARWAHSSFGRHSEIDILLTPSDTWQSVATVESIADIDAEDIASFLTEAVRFFQENGKGSKR